MFAWANSKLVELSETLAPPPDGPAPRLLSSLASRDEAAALSALADPSLDVYAPLKPKGVCAVHVAASCGSLNVLREILARGVRADYSDHNGMAALHHASSSSSMGPNEALETVRYLVEQCGASVVLRDAAGRTPYDVASSQAVRGYLLPRQLQQETVAEQANAPALAPPPPMGGTPVQSPPQQQPSSNYADPLEALMRPPNAAPPGGFGSPPPAMGGMGGPPPGNMGPPPALGGMGSPPPPAMGTPRGNPAMGGAQQQQIPPPGPAQQMPPGPDQVGLSLSASLEVQQQQQHPAPPRQESAPPVQNDSAQPAMTAPPAMTGVPAMDVAPAASKFGLPPPPQLSSLGPPPGAAAATTTSTPANTPMKPADGPPPPDAGPPRSGSSAASSSSGYARRGGRSNAAAVLQSSRYAPDGFHSLSNDRDLQAKYGHVAHDIWASIRSGGVVAGGGTGLRLLLSSGGRPGSGNR